MSKRELPPTNHDPEDIYLSHSQHPQQDAGGLFENLSGDGFADWYRKRQYRRNIRNGQPYFNGMGQISTPERHSPSSLVQCHRKVAYRQLNAPEEQTDPHGIFWFGTKFEEELALPFLQEAVTDEESFVTNSVWVDYTRETKNGEVQVKGSTDPVIVDGEGTPILPTEIKTKSSVDNIDEPNRHHLAQLHAYIVGLNEKYNRDLSHGVLIYGSRKGLDVAVFHVKFDREFWEETVLQWASEHTQYRVDETLPPPNPEYDWECNFCEYKNRCGKGQTDHSDYGPRGLLPDYKGYPREKVIEYLEEHPDESLTPTLARQYPGLVESYDVINWSCSSCDAEIHWEKIDQDTTSPVCPQCAEEGDLSTLTLRKTDERTRAANPGENTRNHP
jgi:CRISPR-associated exonuclease Cas4